MKTISRENQVSTLPFETLETTPVSHSQTDSGCIKYGKNGSLYILGQLKHTVTKFNVSTKQSEIIAIPDTFQDAPGITVTSDFVITKQGEIYAFQTGGGKQPNIISVGQDNQVHNVFPVDRSGFLHAGNDGNIYFLTYCKESPDDACFIVYNNSGKKIKDELKLEGVNSKAIFHILRRSTVSDSLDNLYLGHFDGYKNEIFKFNPQGNLIAQFTWQIDWQGIYGKKHITKITKDASRGYFHFGIKDLAFDPVNKLLFVCVFGQTSIKNNYNLEVWDTEEKSYSCYLDQKFHRMWFDNEGYCYLLDYYSASPFRDAKIIKGKLDLSNLKILQPAGK